METSSPRTRTALRGVRLLIGGYLAIGVLTLGAVALLRDHATVVNDAVWIRGTAVVASALVMSAFAARAARGSRGAYRRLRIIATATVVAIAVIIALPGTFPLWMKIDQGVCGLVLLGVVVVLGGRELRSLFTAG